MLGKSVNLANLTALVTGPIRLDELIKLVSHYGGVLGNQYPEY